MFYTLLNPTDCFIAFAFSSDPKSLNRLQRRTNDFITPSLCLYETFLMLSAHTDRLRRVVAATVSFCRLKHVHVSENDTSSEAEWSISRTLGSAGTCINPAWELFSENNNVDSLKMCGSHRTTLQTPSHMRCIGADVEYSKEVKSSTAGTCHILQHLYTSRKHFNDWIYG